MKRLERLKEIEKLWNSRARSEYSAGSISWEEIQWEPFSVKGNLHEEFEFADVLKQLGEVGHFMYIWGECEEASGWLEWDWALLRGLYTWYNLPEDCAAPLFVNEGAGAICIPDLRWAERRSWLFCQADSVLIGMENLEAELTARDLAEEAKYHADALAGRVRRPKVWSDGSNNLDIQKEAA